jgi:Brp/Blh family beta-carotene 15,15'-monooxygenase
MNMLRINGAFSAITLLLLALHEWLQPGLWFQYIALGVALVLTGIPHGAIDHLIFCSRQGIRPTLKVLFPSFFIPYLLLIAFTVGCWLFFPNLAFMGFLLIACYHFGQSQLFYLPFYSGFLVRAMAYMCWGALVVGGLWYFHWESVSPMLSHLLSWPLQEKGGVVYAWLQFICLVSALFLMVLLVLLLLRKSVPFRLLFSELISICVILVFIHRVGPVLGFAVYFGLWHAARVMLTEYGFLAAQERQPIPVTKFIRSFIPFSLVSFAGFALLVVFIYFFNLALSPSLLFVVFISALTTPHAWVMESMYGRIKGIQGMHTAPISS